MTDEQINAAIAEVCEWGQNPVVNTDGKGRIWVTNYPNYCTDLNAIHEAEQEQWRKNHNSRYDFLYELSNIVMPSTGYRAEAADLLDAILDATARQRAEAFLKTIGKWKNE